MIPSDFEIVLWIAVAVRKMRCRENSRKPVDHTGTKKLARGIKLQERDRNRDGQREQGKNEGEISFDIARYNPVRDVSSAYPSVTGALARALQPPPFGGGYPEPLLHRRWHPRHSN